MHLMYYNLLQLCHIINIVHTTARMQSTVGGLLYMQNYFAGVQTSKKENGEMVLCLLKYKGSSDASQHPL